MLGKRNVRSFDLIGGYQHRGAFVLYEENDRRFGLASVSPDDVNILGPS